MSLITESLSTPFDLSEYRSGSMSLSAFSAIDVLFAASEATKLPLPTSE